MDRLSLGTLLLTLLVALASSACDDGGGIFYPDAGLPDAGGDSDLPDSDLSDSGCQFDSQCEDGIDCTLDTCDRTTGLCDHTPEHERCHDDSRCNGFEFCDAMLGCQPGIPNQECNDGIACTVDICNEGTSPEHPVECEYEPMDRDGDGHVDSHCAVDPIDDPDGPRGDDCDDLDPDRFPGAGEFCFDGRDNDCDLDVDDADDDCMLHNDDCAGAIELTAGRVREGFTIGAGALVDASCGWTSYQDVVYFFELEEAADVTLEVWGRDYFYPIVAVQTECGDRDTELRCVSGGTEARFFSRGMEAGTYYVVVESWSEGIFDVLLTVEPVTPPPEGEDCTDPISITEGAPVTVDLGEFESDVRLSCASSDSYPDVVYAFALSEPRDVRYEATGSGVTPYIGVRTICEDLGTDIFCDGGNPQARSLCALPTGTHFLVLRGSRSGEVELELTFSEPSEPPPNDVCADGIDVSAGGTFPGTLLCSSGDHDLSCDYWDEHDVAYTFTTTEEQDVEIHLRPEDSLNASMVLSTDCASTSSELLCIRDSSPHRLVRALPAGTYYILVAGEYAAAFELDVTFSTPTSACDSATVITESTVITDDTTGTGNDFTSTCGGRAEGTDIPYIIDVPYDFHLSAEVTDALFDTVLHLRSSCDDPSSEIECDDDGAGAGNLSHLEVSDLPAGTYVLVMDGFWSGAEGPFTLDVDITPADPCVDPPLSTGSTTVSGDTCSASGVQAGSCGGAGAPDEVHAIELTAASDLSATLSAASYDAVLHLRSDCDDVATELDCDGTTPLPSIAATGLAAGIYYILVDGAAAAACGTYTLDVTVTPI